MQVSKHPFSPHPPTDMAHDEDVWDEIVDADFSDNESELPVEDDEIVLVPIALAASSPTIWEILVERLANSSFEARFVDPEQQRLNAAVMKKRLQLDPAACHNWTTKCGRHQVVGCFILYIRGTVGLFTQDGFPVYVKLDELSAEDVNFVLTKLGDPLRGKVKAQLSGKLGANQTKASTANKDNEIPQESRSQMSEKAGMKGSQHMTYDRYQESREVLHKGPAHRITEAGESANDRRVQSVAPM